MSAGLNLLRLLPIRTGKDQLRPLSDFYQRLTAGQINPHVHGPVRRQQRPFGPYPPGAGYCEHVLTQMKCVALDDDTWRNRLAGIDAGHGRLAVITNQVSGRVSQPVSINTLHFIAQRSSVEDIGELVALRGPHLDSGRLHEPPRLVQRERRRIQADACRCLLHQRGVRAGDEIEPARCLLAHPPATIQVRLPLHAPDAVEAVIPRLHALQVIHHQEVASLGPDDRAVPAQTVVIVQARLEEPHVIEVRLRGHSCKLRYRACPAVLQHDHRVVLARLEDHVAVVVEECLPLIGVIDDGVGIGM